MDQRPVKIFNAFDLQFGPNAPDHLHLQEAIHYCESRFRSILSAFSRATHQTQRVIQRGLHKELVCTVFLCHPEIIHIFIRSFRVSC